MPNSFEGKLKHSSYFDEFEGFDSYLNELYMLFDQESWELAKKKNEVKAYEQYMINFYDGHYLCSASKEIDQLKWLGVKSSNNVIDFKNYIKERSNSLYIGDAKKHIDEITDDQKLWSKIIKESTLSAFKKYLKVSNRNLYSKFATQNIKELTTDRQQWYYAKKVDSEDSYDSYLEKCKHGKRSEQYVESAKLALREIRKDKRAWNEAKAKDTKQSYLNYINDTSLKRKSFIFDVKAELKIIEEDLELWKETRVDDTDEAYKKYIMSHPGGNKNSSKLDLAKQYRTEFEDDLVAWQAAKKSNTTQAYNDYINHICSPRKIYVKEAELKLKELKEDKYYGALALIGIIFCLGLWWFDTPDTKIYIPHYLSSELGKLYINGEYIPRNGDGSYDYPFIYELPEETNTISYKEDGFIYEPVVAKAGKKSVRLQAISFIDYAQKLYKERKKLDAANYFKKVSSTKLFTLALKKDEVEDHEYKNFIYEIACDKKHAGSCNNLGVSYTDGRGIKANKIKGNNLFKKSCEYKGAYGCTNYAFNLLEGDGVKKSVSVAIYYFEKGCSYKKKKACEKLSDIYKLGSIVPKNLTLAKKWESEARKL